MRRSDREVTDIAEITDLLRRADTMRLGQGNFRLNPRKFIALGADPYVVPLSFGFAEEGGRIKIYFHGAKAGMKHDLIRANPLYAPNLTSCAVTRRFRAASRRNTRV